MASRAQQKEAARQRRLAEEQERTERERRQRRMQMLIGIIVIAVVIVGVGVAISTSGGSKKAPTPGSSGAKAAATTVAGLVSGIPQSGTRLGAPTAPVTVTEYGDLQCPICRDFATSAEQQLISSDVRPGKVQLVYRSLCTATCNGGDNNVFPVQQAAALAAGLQAKAWNYILLFYNEQGQEDTGYVNDTYLNGLAGQISGLNYSKWLSDRSSPTLANQVTADQQQAAGLGFNSTPSITIQGPKGQAQPIVGAASYSQIEAEIKSVS